MTLQLVARTGYPDFLDLPWHLPLDEWQSGRLVEVTRGIHRHVVRFVNYDGHLFALKELPQAVAEKEYRLLRELKNHAVPSVEGIGVVRDRGRYGDTELDAVLITRYLDFSLPYRVVFSALGADLLQATLLDALALLLVRLHLIGFFWGDCSLSNALFQRDAGALTAYLVDAETAELRPQLERGMRHYDLEIARENVCGDLLDLQASGVLPAGIDPFETAEELERRYDSLWTDLTREEEFSLAERFRIDRRLQRLNELGFDVQEIELVRQGDKYRLKLDPQVVETGHHQRRFLMLTGLQVQENQARRLLNDIAAYRAHLERLEGHSIPEAVAAYRWRNEVFEPVIAAVPRLLADKLTPAEIFHQVLDHRWYLSEQAGKDVGTDKAVASYVANVLPSKPNERIIPISGSDLSAADGASEEPSSEEPVSDSP